MDVPFCVGTWKVQPQLNRISGPAGDVHLQPKAMHLLSCLARHAPEVVTKERIFQEVWDGAFVTDEALTFVIWELRKALGDDARRPRYIETVPKKGYRLIASPRLEGREVELEGVGRHDGSLGNDGPATAARQLRSSARRRGWLLAVAAFGLAVGGGLAIWIVMRPGKPPGVRFADRDWVLVLALENRTGETSFNGSLDLALEHELLRSAFVNVIPRERVADTLRLMRRAPDSRIDAGLAREIALRDGAIKAILAGRIEARSGHYLVSVRVVDPASGALVSGVSAEARTHEGVLRSFPGLALDLRRALGEALPALPAGEARLQRASTASLGALKLFSEAMVFVEQDKWPPAAELLERAVREDPEFAMAHIFLAHSLSNLGVPGAGPHYEKAFALADDLPDRERYFILGSYHSRHRGDDLKAVEAYEILTTLYPDDYWGTHKLSNAYDRLGRYREAAAYRVRAADLRPHSFWENFRATSYSLYHRGGRATELPCFRRAKALVTLEVEKEAPEEVANLELMPSHEAWNEGDLPRARREVERLARSMESRSVVVRRHMVADLGRAYLSLGMIEAAEARFRTLADHDRQDYFLAQAALARGDVRSFDRHLSRVDFEGQIRTERLDASLLPLSGGTGLRTRARAARSAGVLEGIQGLPERLQGVVRDFATAARGEQALTNGSGDEAVRLLGRAVERLGAHPRPVYFLAVESLADAWEGLGHPRRAVQVLEDAVLRDQAAFWDGLFRMRVQLRLAELNRRLGSIERAQAIEAELRHRLVYADPDHAVLRRVEELAGMDRPRLAVAASPPRG